MMTSPTVRDPFLGETSMTTTRFAALAADTYSIDPVALALAARRNRDAYVAAALVRGVR